MDGSQDAWIQARAEAEEAVASLKAALSDPVDAGGCTVFLHRKGSERRSKRWTRLKFADGLAEQFREQVTSSLIGRLGDATDLALYDYDEAPAGQIVALEIAKLPEMKMWAESVPTPEYQQIFDGDPAHLKQVDLHATTLHVGDERRQLTVFKGRSQSTLLRTGGFLAMFNMSQHQFDEISGKIFEFSPAADFVHWGEFIFIFSMPVFETLTNIRNVTLGEAKAALDGVKEISGLEVAGLDAIAATLQDNTRLAKKLAFARTHGTYKAWRLPELTELVAARRIPLKVEHAHGKMHVRLDPGDKAQVKAFVELVSETFLTSKLTGMDWDAHVKSRPKR
jgi:hypothetical protein